MGVQENSTRKRTRRNELRGLILQTVGTVGIVSVALVAPNVVGAMSKLGLIPSSRQNEVVRRSTGRLVKQRLLQWKDGKLCLTDRGRTVLQVYRLSHHSQKPKYWDGKWRVLIFDIPNYRGTLRDRVRHTLQSIGFVRLQNSVWAYPYDCEDLVMLLKADFKIGKDMLYMIVDSIEQDGALVKQFGLKR